MNTEKWGAQTFFPKSEKQKEKKKKKVIAA